MEPVSDARNYLESVLAVVDRDYLARVLERETSRSL
jgi:hypothetical protein